MTWALQICLLYVHWKNFNPGLLYKLLYLIIECWIKIKEINWGNYKKFVDQSIDAENSFGKHSS